MAKKLSKSGILVKFAAKKFKPGFLTLDNRTGFNCLRLVFTKALILWHYDLEYYIEIETYVSSYAIGGVLSLLTSGTSSDKIITKIIWASSIQ